MYPIMASDPRSPESPTKDNRIVIRRRDSSVKRSSRKRKAISYKENSSDDEPEIDKVINATAARNKLSEDNVKDILQNLLSNEQVLEACKLRAQEINMHLDEEKQNLSDILLAETPTGSKLTRNKARELNHPILPELALSIAKPGSDDDYDMDEDSSNEEVEDDYDFGPVFKKPTRPPPTRKLANRPKSPPGQVIVPDSEEEEPWVEFLNQFQDPDRKETEDDETDPEYVGSEPPEDELVVMTKKETRVMWKEALDCVEEIFETVHPSGKEVSLPIPNQSPKKNKSASPRWNLKPKGVAVQETVTDLSSMHQSSQPRPPVDQQQSLPPSTIAITNPPIELPLLIPPAPGVQSVLIFNPNPTLLPKYNLTLGSDNNAYLMPQLKQKKPPEEDPIPKPKSAFLKINLNDDLPTIIAQITSQRLVYSQEMEREKWVVDGWTKKGLRIYHKQLLSHIQFLGQMFVQTYSHPVYWPVAKHHMKMLTDLGKEANKEGTWFLRELAWNLQDMLTICEDWKAELDVESEANRKYVQWIMDENKRIGRREVKRYFPDRVMERLVSHRAFMFVQYLPVQPPARKGLKLDKPIFSKLSALLVMLMHNSGIDPNDRCAFHKTYRLYQEKYRNTETYLNFQQTWANCEARRAYERTKEWPKVVPEQLEFRSYDECSPLVDLPFDQLPLRWARYCYSRRRFAIAHYDLDGEIRKKEEKPKLGRLKAAVVTVDYSKFKAQFKVPAMRANAQAIELSEDANIKYEEPQLSPVKEKPTKVIKKRGGQVKPIEEYKNYVKLEELPQEFRAVKHNRRRRPNPDELQMMKERGKKILEDFIRQELKSRKPNPAIIRLRNKKTMTAKLMQLLNRWDHEYDENLDCLEEEDLESTKVFRFIKEFDIFIRLFHGVLLKRPTRQVGKLPPGGTLRPDSGNKEQLQGYFKSIRRNDEERESVPLGESRKYPKDALFSFKFLKDVDLTSPSAYQRLLVDLKNFPWTGSLPDFYQLLENLLLSSHPKLLAQFLSYVLPEYAFRISRFCEQSLHNDNMSFLAEVNSYMEKREDQLDGIYELLNRSWRDKSIRKQLSDMLVMNRSSNEQSIGDQLGAIFLDNPLLRQWLDQFEVGEHDQTGNGPIIFPGILIELVYSLEEESNAWSTMRLQLSDDEADGDSDDVVFVPNEGGGTGNRLLEESKSSSVSVESFDEEDSEGDDESSLSTDGSDSERDWEEVQQ